MLFEHKWPNKTRLCVLRGLGDSSLRPLLYIYPCVSECDRSWPSHLKSLGLVFFTYKTIIIYLQAGD